MKRNVGGRILYVLLALVLLACIVPVSALLVSAESEAVTIYASNLNDDSQLSLSDDTVLVMDVDRRLSAIIGEDYDLTIEGSGKLTVNGSGNGIAVKSLHCTSDLFVQPGWHAIEVSETVYIDNAESFIVGGIYAGGHIDIQCDNATIGGNDNAIFSSLGNITLSGGTFDIGANGVAVAAETGGIYMTGAFTVNSNDGRTIDTAKGEVVINGSLKSTSGAKFDPDVHFINRDFYSIGAAGGFNFYGTTLEVTGLGGIRGGGINVADSDISITADSVSIITERYYALCGENIYVDSDELWLENEGSEENENVTYNFSTVLADKDVTLSSESGGIVGEIALTVWGTLSLNGNFVVGGDPDHDNPLVIADRMEATGTLVLRNDKGLAVDATESFSFSGTTLDIEGYGGIDAEGGVNITADNVSVFTQKLTCIEGQTVYIDCGVLRLENEPDVNDPEVGQYGIACYESATVNCPDATIITCDHGVYGNGCDVTLNGNFTILGKGNFGKGIWASNLYLDGGQFTVSSNILQAIDAGRVEVKGNLSVSTKGEENCVAAQEFVFDGTTLTANGYSGIVAGNIDITADSTMIITSAYGVYSETGNITLNGNFTISAQINAVCATNGTITMTGAVTAQGGNGNFAIAATGDITFDGTKLDVKGSSGIRSVEGDVTIKGTNVSVVGDDGVGVVANSGSISIDSDYLFVQCAGQSGDALWEHGIGASKDVTIISDDATIAGLYGISSDTGNVTLSGNFTVGAQINAVIASKGTITMTGAVTAQNTNEYEYVICAMGDISFTGTTLNVTGDYGISSAEGDISIVADSTTVITDVGAPIKTFVYTFGDYIGAEGGSVYIDSDYLYLHNKMEDEDHPLAQWDGIMAGTNVTVYSQNATIVGKYGVFAIGDIKLYGNLDIAGGLESAVCSDEGDITLSNGTFNIASASNAVITYNGNIYLNGDFTVSSSETDSCAINAREGDIVIQGGSLNVTTGGTHALGAANGNIEITQPLQIVVPQNGHVDTNNVIANASVIVDANGDPVDHVLIGKIISEISVNVNTPVAGKEPIRYSGQVYNMPLGGSVRAIRWYKNGELWDVSSGNARFEAGNTYRLEISLVTHDGYYFADPLTSAAINYQTAAVSAPTGQPAYELVLSLDFGKCPAVISNVELTIDAPRENDFPDQSVTCGSSIYEQALVGDNMFDTPLQWQKSEDGITWTTMDLYETFTVGYYYRVFIDIMPANGYRFAIDPQIEPDVSAKVNGFRAEVTRYPEEDPQELICVFYNFGLLNHSIIQQIDIDGVTEPVVGEHPSYECAISGTGYGINTAYSNGTYVINGICWYDVTYEMWMRPDDTFQIGHEYKVFIDVKTEDGYEFDTEQVGSSYRPVGWGYINDNYATLGIQSDGRYEQSLSWTFTCKPQTVKSVMVSGLDAPESSATPDFDAITDSEYYTVDSVTWFDYTTGLDLTASDTFVEGHEYWVLVTVIPSQVDGQNMCKFVSDKTVATLNGIEVRKETNKHWQEVESSINFVRIYYTFICGEEDPIAIRVQPTNQTADEGSQIQFSVIATGEGLTYQWQYRTSSTGSWKDTTLSGAKTNTLKVTASNVRNGYQYRCVITDANGNTMISNAATLTVKDPLYILIQPSSMTASLGETVSFTVTASGTGLTYQWQYLSSPSGSWKNTTLSGAKTNSLKVIATEVRNGYQYRCVITNASGKTVTSDAVTLTLVDALTITGQPESISATVGETVNFTVTASGEGLSYQWQYRTSSTGSWKVTTLSGAKTNTLKVIATDVRNGYQYRCVITDASGKTVTSDAATLTVKNALTITAQPKSASAAVGETVNFTVTASGEGLTYQWQYRTSSTGSWKTTTLSGAKTNTLKVIATDVRNGYQYRCVITDAGGNKVTSNAATLTVTAGLTITAQPKSISATVGETVNFTVTASGEGLTYQWQYRTSSTGSWKNTTLSGAKTNTLKVIATDVRNGYQYRCVVTDADGNQVTSNAATLTVETPISITHQPVSVTANLGETVTFTVTASGEGLTYQWQYRSSSTGSWKNTTLTGAKTDTLKAVATEARNGYQYRCVITDANGNTVTSVTVTLKVS